MTGYNKLTTYNPKNKRIQEFSLESGITIYKANQIGRSDLILLGTSHGLFRVKYTRERGFEYVDQPCSNVLEIKDFLIRENDNEIWMATNNGVVVVQMEDYKIKRLFTNSFEVSNPKVTALVEDGNGRIWASTFFGITVYNTTDGTIRFVNKSQGIINNEFNTNSSCLLDNGNIIFGGLNGFEIIDPVKLNDFGYSKNFHISGIERIQTDKTKEFSNYQEGQIISFRTGKESIIIHLSQLDFQFKKGYSFRYSIDGNNWFDSDEKASIVLSDLAYGEYTLKIQMFDPFQNLVQEKTFPVEATAPFYLKTSYHIFFGLFFLAMLALFGLNVLRSMRIRVITKAKIAMDLHDESGTILTRLLLLSKKEKFEAKEKELIQNGLKEALYSFRTYLDSISTKSHSLQDLSDDLKEFVNSACSDAGMQSTFKIDFDKNYNLNRELYRDVKLSVYEIVSNCLKHANADLISLYFRAEKKKLFIQVIDNGTCDLSSLEAQKGNGIQNISKRVKRNYGIVRHSIFEGKTGLTTEIELPIA
jgi:two-component sensor histidine kinase